ncbi:LuxR C-terminal-related transcriptional regulator [Endothiovibrio diazotrophicus]
MPPSLITTKLFIPPPRPNQVDRDRLQHLLRQGLKGKLTLVSAPAGFGKTTLVSTAIRQTGGAVAWISLHENDGNLLGFLALVAAALQRAVPNGVPTTHTLLQSAQPPAGDIVLAALLDELTTLESELALVLDDYHAVDSREINDALAFLLEHGPQRLHWVIVSREDPALPLARLRARGELCEVRAAQLRFSEAEATTFLNQTMALALSREYVAALTARTEGWITGLQLAGLSLQGRSDGADFVDAFAGSHRFVLDYLVEEVLLAQPPEVRDFLLKTSVLERFNAELSEAVTGVDRAAVVLERLERQNLFLIPLDDQRRWYRFHHLFGEVLQVRLSTSDVDIKVLHQRAADWLHAEDFVADAIHHAVLAENTQFAADIIEQAWPELRKREPEGLFLGWMKALPEHLITASPVLSAHYGLALLSHDPAAAPRWLESAEARLQPARDQPRASGGRVLNEAACTALPGLLAVGRAYHAGASGDVAGIVEHAGQALDLLPDGEAVWRGSAAVLLGLVQWNGGDLSAAVAAIGTGHKAMQAAGEISGMVSTAYLLANLSIAQGRHKTAERWCRKALARVAEHRFAPQGAADIHVTLALLALGRYQLDQARDHLAQARALGEPAKLLETAHHWFIIQALLQTLEGRYGDAEDLLAEAAEVRIPSPAPDFAPIAAWQARLDVLQGDLHAARRWAQLSDLHADDAPAFHLVFSHLTLVRVLIAAYRRTGQEQDRRDAQRLLEKLRHATATGQAREHGLEIHLLIALLHHATGDAASAAAALQTAFAQPEAEHQIHRFAAEDAEALSWIREYIVQGNAPAWADVLLPAEQTTPAPGSPAEIPPPPVEALSDRELEVLRLLRTELGGPQIAEHLFVSKNTLKTHTKNIYAKLGVNNRRAAVRRAGELGID